MSFGDFFGGLFGTSSDDWAAIEAGIRAWVVTASGLPEAQIIFAEQDGPRPGLPFITVHLGGLVPLGAVDAIEQDYDPSADAGSEITLATIGQRELTVTIRAYTLSTIGGGSARALLSKVQTSLGVGRIREGFWSAGFTCFDNGTITSIPAVLDTRWEGRAELTVRFYVVETASETTGYADKVEVTDESDDPIPPFTVDAS